MTPAFKRFRCKSLSCHQDKSESEFIKNNMIYFGFPEGILYDHKTCIISWLILVYWVHFIRCYLPLFFFIFILLQKSKFSRFVAKGVLKRNHVKKIDSVYCFKTIEFPSRLFIRAQQFWERPFETMRFTMDSSYCWSDIETMHLAAIFIFKRHIIKFLQNPKKYIYFIRGNRQFNL